MAKKKEMLDEIFCVPITKSMKQKIVKIADQDERRPAEMGRILFGEAIRAREQKRVEQRETEAATA